MRNVYLVAYDMPNDAKRTKVFKKLKGYGEALQYSLFRCCLSPGERLRLKSELWTMIDHATDRMLLIDLGPDDGRGQSSIEAWGDLRPDPAEHTGTLIV